MQTGGSGETKLAIIALISSGDLIGSNPTAKEARRRVLEMGQCLGLFRCILVRIPCNGAKIEV